MRGRAEFPGDPTGDTQLPAAGTLILAASPIGSLDDASGRFTAELAAAPVIAAEDTTRLRRLAGRLGIKLTGRVYSYWDAAEARRQDQLLAELRAGRDVLLVTDAGMPGVSDPGYRLTAAAAAAGIRDRVCFEGFPPRGGGERARRFAELASEPRTMVFFESPRRAGTTLRELAAAFGEERRAVVCRELTKTHEEIRRGPLGELAAWADGGLRGEITLVVGGATAASPEARAAEVSAAAAEVDRRVASGSSRKDAVAAVAAEAGLPRRLVYEAAVSPRASS
jgi:16S rRNA (cytidine1402-2'-O)-methyltransferase